MILYTLMVVTSEQTQSVTTAATSVVVAALVAGLTGVAVWIRRVSTRQQTSSTTWGTATRDDLVEGIRAIRVDIRQIRDDGQATRTELGEVRRRLDRHEELHRQERGTA